MSGQWPLLIPFVSMAVGLTLSLQSGRYTPLFSLVAAFICLLLAFFHSDKRLFSACTALFFFLLGFFALAPWLTPDYSSFSIRRLKPDTPVTLEGVVASRPSVSPDGSSIVVSTEKIFRGKRGETVKGRLMLYVAKGDISLVRGDRIRFITRVSLPRLLGLPGEFDYPSFLAFQEVAAIGRVASQEEIVLIRGGAEETLQRSIDLVARKMGDAIRAAVPDEQVSSVLAALLIGDQKRIPRELAEAYTRSGVNHILSISGFHVGIIATFIALAALWLLTRSEYLASRLNLRRLVVLLALPSMLIYLFLTGNAPATARSVIMLAAFAFALYAERESDPINTLLLAAFILVAIKPPTLFDLSFQLSFISLWGIVIAVPMLESRVSFIKSVYGRTLVQFIAASVAASCVTLIPVLFSFKVASLNGVLTNFLIVPLLGYGAVLAGFCVLPLLLVIPSFSHILLWPTASLIELSNWIIRVFAKLPVIRFHGITKWDMFFFLLFLTVMTFIKNKKIRVITAVSLPVAAVAMHIAMIASSDGRLQITMLSVGQAESILLKLPDGKTMLVDGGGYLHDTGRDFGQRTLAPALGALGVSRIDWIVSTHDHPDHTGGLPFVTRHFNVGKFLSTPYGVTSASPEEFRKIFAEQQIPLLKLTAGDSFTLSEGVELKVLSPSILGERHYGADEMNVNEESLVFRLTYRKFSMLFTADAGFEAEDRILSAGYKLDSTVLKVGHHGSRYSTSEQFLQKVNPKLALISAGASNRFGLPASRTLDLLAKSKIPVYRTDRDGTIELITDGLTWSVSTPYSE